MTDPHRMPPPRPTPTPITKKLPGFLGIIVSIFGVIALLMKFLAPKKTTSRDVMTITRTSEPIEPQEKPPYRGE